VRNVEQTTAERLLWCTVIYNALQEASGVVRGPKSTHDAVRAEATKWLTGNDPDFRAVCIMAGLEPDAVRNGAIGIIESGKKLRIGRTH
jgi:hypothetical protein